MSVHLEGTIAYPLKGKKFQSLRGIDLFENITSQFTTPRQNINLCIFIGVIIPLDHMLAYELPHVVQDTL